MHNLRKLLSVQLRSINSLIGSNSNRNRFCTTSKETSTETERTTHFGFKTVGENEKEQKGLAFRDEQR